MCTFRNHRSSFVQAALGAVLVVVAVGTVRAGDDPDYPHEQLAAGEPGVFMSFQATAGGSQPVGDDPAYPQSAMAAAPAQPDAQVARWSHESADE